MVILERVKVYIGRDQHYRHSRIYIISAGLTRAEAAKASLSHWSLVCFVHSIDQELKEPETQFSDRHTDRDTLRQWCMSSDPSGYQLNIKQIKGIALKSPVSINNSPKIHHRSRKYIG